MRLALLFALAACATAATNSTGNGTAPATAPATASAPAPPLGPLGAPSTEYKGDDPNGSCGSTDAEVVSICAGGGGVCHSFLDSTTNNATFRGTWMNKLLFLHRQDYSKTDPNSDFGFVKTMHFTGPGVANVSSCAADFVHVGNNRIVAEKIKQARQVQHRDQLRV